MVRSKRQHIRTKIQRSKLRARKRKGVVVPASNAIRASGRDRNRQDIGKHDIENELEQKMPKKDEEENQKWGDLKTKHISIPQDGGEQDTKTNNESRYIAK